MYLIHTYTEFSIQSQTVLTFSTCNEFTHFSVLFLFCVCLFSTSSSCHDQSLKGDKTPIHIFCYGPPLTLTFCVVQFPMTVTSTWDNQLRKFLFQLTIWEVPICNWLALSFVSQHIVAGDLVEQTCSSHEVFGFLFFCFFQKENIKASFFTTTSHFLAESRKLSWHLRLFWQVPGLYPVHILTFQYSITRPCLTWVPRTCETVLTKVTNKPLVTKTWWAERSQHRGYFCSEAHQQVTPPPPPGHPALFL